MQIQKTHAEQNQPNLHAEMGATNGLNLAQPCGRTRPATNITLLRALGLLRQHFTSCTWHGPAHTITVHRSRSASAAHNTPHPSSNWRPATIPQFEPNGPNWEPPNSMRHKPPSERRCARPLAASSAPTVRAVARQASRCRCAPARSVGAKRVRSPGPGRPAAGRPASGPRCANSTRHSWALFSSLRNPKNFQDSPSHRILRHMHEALNINKN